LLKNTGGRQRINSVAIFSLSCTPELQFKVTDGKALEPIVIAGFVPSVYAVTTAPPESFSLLFPSILMDVIF
jgi:hypothetical protein